MLDCPALASKAVPGHTHTCNGQHDAGAPHVCADRTCRRWYGIRGEVI